MTRAPLDDPQALADVADYLGASEEDTSLLWPQMVHAWSGYLTTGQFGTDTVLDLRVMDAIVRAGLDGLDLWSLDWRP